MTCDDEWYRQRLEKAEALILAIEEAIEALTVGGAQQYSLNTGQTQQTVTKLNLRSLNDQLASLENRRSTLMLRLEGAGHIVAPGW